MKVDHHCNVAWKKNLVVDGRHVSSDKRGCCGLQDQPWAKYQKLDPASSSSDKKPSGDACAVCHDAIRQAFPLLSWSSVITKAKVSETFKGAVQEALGTYRLLKAGREARFQQQSVSSCQHIAYSLEDEMQFLTAEQYESRFGISMEEVGGLKVLELQAPDGSHVKGVAVRMDDQPLRLKLSSAGMVCTEAQVLPAQQQLREDQAKETQDHLVETMIKEKRLAQRAPLLAELAEAAEQAKERQARTKAEREMAASLSIHPSLALEEEGKEAEPKQGAGLLGKMDLQELEASSPEQKQQRGWSGLFRNKKEKEKPRRGGQGHGGAQGRGRGAGKRAASMTHCSASQVGQSELAPSEGGFDPVARSSAGSVAPPASATAKKKERLVKQQGMSPKSMVSKKQKKSGSKGPDGYILADSPRADELHKKAHIWMNALVINNILAGHPSGNDKYQATRIKNAFQAECPTHATHVKLLSHLELVEHAETLASKLPQTSVADRERMISDLEKDVPDLIWPPELRASLLAMTAKELLERFKAGEVPVSDIRNTIMPSFVKSESETEDKFDPKKPTLKECAFQDIGAGKVFLKLAVSDGLVPLVMGGERDLKAATAWAEMLAASPSNHATQGPVLAAALGEAVTCSKAVLTLVNPAAHALTDLDQVMSAREGIKQLLRQTISQSQWYRHAEQELRKCEVAHASMGPKLEKLKRELDDHMQKQTLEPDFLKQAFTDVAVWRSALREGTTDAILGDLLKSSQQLFSSSNNVDHITTLEALAHGIAGVLPSYIGSHEACGAGSSCSFELFA